MAGPYYVDPAASGANDGTSWTDAWETLQRAVDGTDGTQPVAGDTVYCRGTETLSATCDLDGNNGSGAAGFIKYIGCNAGGTVDGTRYKMDADSTASICISHSANWHWFENFEIYGATGYGVDYNGVHHSVWINCISRNNGSNGWELYYYTDDIFVRCQAYSNGGHGFANTYTIARFLACLAKDNTEHGFQPESVCVAVGCVSHNNGGGGFDLNNCENTMLINCIADENDDQGIGAAGDMTLIAGCRITDNGKDTSGYGIQITTDSRAVCGWNFLVDNDSGATDGNLDAIPLDADADTNETSGTEGYVDGADDFNLEAGATLRSVAIELD